MNKQELRAIMLIAKKLHWNGKPVEMVIETIQQMIVAKQCQELADCGDCDDEEETLLSIAMMETSKLWRLKHKARLEATEAEMYNRNTWIINNCWS